MQTFRCSCGARLFFENTRCLSCARELGFVPERFRLCALEPAGDDGSFRASGVEGSFRKCGNHVEHGVCNWMVAASDPQPLCLACRLNNVIPDLDHLESRERWAEVEKAKRRLVYTLARLRLPLVPKSEDPENGLAFDIKAENGSEQVLTGHADGLITLNLAEADDVARERMRVAMKERYRTLLGHFRHEIGHYYWAHLLREPAALDEFRRLFGDERADYGDALQRHYASASEAPQAFADSHISAYATAHPWEDWAETFAHYLHVIDTLETAHDFGFTSDVPRDASLAEIADFDLLLREWLELTVALNALNRSMGVPDAYPFAISSCVRGKLEFVHRRIGERAALPETPSPRR